MNRETARAAAALSLVLGPFALAGGWLTGYALDGTQGPAQRPAIVQAAPVPALPREPLVEVEQQEPAREMVRVVERAPATSTPRPARAITSPPAPAIVASAPAPAPLPPPAPVVEQETPDQPTTTAPTWTQADQDAADASCVEQFGPDSRAQNTPAIGDEYDPELRYPCSVQ